MRAKGSYFILSKKPGRCFYRITVCNKDIVKQKDPSKLLPRKGAGGSYAELHA